jgi:hypothetical protein
VTTPPGSLQRRRIANDDGAIEPSINPEAWNTAFSDPAFRRDLESVVEQLIDLLTAIDGDTDLEQNGDFEDDY